MDSGDDQPLRPTTVRDWRWAIGVLGRVLIVFGLLIFGFVGYQLWGTGIEFRSNQADAADEFKDAQSSLVGALVPTIPRTTSPGVTTVPSAPIESGATTLAPSSSESPAPALTIPPVALGDVVGALTMPSITGKTYYLVAGVRVEDLKRGVGHYPSTPLPGEYGNAALAGHRTTYGAPFEDLDKLKPGDRLIIDTLLGQHYEYVVDSSEIIRPNETRVLSQPADGTAAHLTLTTCHPKRSTKKRLVIYSTLDLAASSPPTPRTANYQSVTTPPSIAATTIAPTTAPPTTVAGAPTTSRPASTATPTTTPQVITATTAPAIAGGEPVDRRDAEDLARGWFHDGGAWLHVILWGALLTVISLLGWLLGRKVGRTWVAYAAAFAPFLVGLYFFYQNVNRLLPPGL